MPSLLAQAVTLSASLLLTPQPPAQNLSDLPSCPQTCGRAQRCCELGCPPSEDINCAASFSDPIGQCINSYGVVLDVLVLSCSCSVYTGSEPPVTGVAYQTNCSDV
jgi:hypothetical protein